jgi:cysteine desulfurase / selenocysteine lyase
VRNRLGGGGVPVLVDGSQAVGHLPLALGDIRPSAFCFSGHKGLLGPEGTGGLWIDEGFEPEPLLWGGTGSDSASELQPRSFPDRYEAGTQKAPALAGLLEALARIPRLRVPGPRPGEKCVPVVSIVARGLYPGELAVELGKRGVAARPYLHCAPGAHRELGTIGEGGTLRLSPGYSTDTEEIDEAVTLLEEMMA